MNNILILLEACLLFILSCKNQDSITVNFRTIDLEKSINNLEVIKLSQFTDNIEYLPLETNNYFILHSNSKCEILDSLILLYDLNECKLFNLNGKFLRNIGIKGRGPGEFQFCIQACFTNNNSIYIQDFQDLIEYNIDGTFKKKYKYTFRVENLEERFISNWILINDSTFFGHVPNRSGHMKNKAILINKQGHILYSWKNYEVFDIKFGNPEDERADIYFFKGILNFKQFFNDTLFHLDSKNELVPKYSFNLGNLKIPMSVRVNRMGGKELWSYISIFNVYQTEDYLFLNCLFGDRFPAKRLTPHTFIPQAGPSWYNTTYMLGIADKRTCEVSFCEPTSTDNPLFTSGIYNDIDAGPRFFPKRMINDSTMVMWVSADRLRAHVTSEDFKNTVVKFPEKKQMLQELASNLDIFGNPILIFVTFRK